MARLAAPAAFLLAVTIAVLLVHAGLGGKTLPGSTPRATTTRARRPPPTTTATVARKPPARAPAQYYVIQSGDSFDAVAAKLHTTVQRIEALNPGVSSNSLHVGQRIRVR